MMTGSARMENERRQMAEYIYEITKDSDGVDCYIKRGEIVRCKDCKHREEYECNNIMLGGTKCGVTDDWYCADGERKERR